LLGDTDDSFVGGMIYSNADNALYFNAGNSERMRIDSSGNVGIGTDSPASLVTGGSSPVLSIGGTDSTLTNGEKTGSLSFITIDGSYTGTYSDGITGEIASIAETGVGGGYGLAFYTGVTTSSNRAERVRIDMTGNVGIGTDDPSSPLSLDVTAGTVPVFIDTNISSSEGSVDIIRASTINDEDVALTLIREGSTKTGLAFKTTDASTLSEAMRIDSSGNLLVGKTATGISTVGTTLFGDGTAYHTVDDDVTMRLNRLTDDGDIVEFRKDGGVVGSIGTHSPDRFYLAGASYGIAFDTGDTSMLPTTNTGGGTNGQVDLGKSDARWRSLHLSEAIISSGVKQTTAATTQVIIETFAHASYDGAKVVITAATSADTYVTELLIATNGTTAVATEYGQVGTGSALATYDVDISGADVRILATPASTTSTTFRVAMTLT